MLQPTRPELEGTVLARLSRRSRRVLGACDRLVAFEAGATVLAEDQPTPFLAIVESGRVALRLRVPGGSDQATIVTVEPGELVGWSAVVPPYRAAVDAVAIAPTTLRAFDAEPLRERLATDRNLAADLLPLVLESVASRLTASWQQLLDLFAVPAPEPW
jgi:CRP/FNR family transcriptional regulator, cyclic AMP receptor protein